jgi:hypothetical protein
MYVKAASFVCVLGLLSSCAHGTDAESLIITEGKSLTKLQLIDAENYHKTVFQPGLSGLEPSKENQIRQQCKGPEKEPERALVPLAFLIGPAIDFVLERVDKALQSELQEYVAAYSGSVDEKFYKSTEANGLLTAWTCFRFSRAVGPTEQETVVMDLIGQIMLTDEKDALKIRPLRLYFEQGKAKGKQIGVTLSMKAESVWRQDNRGLSEKVFDYHFLSDKVDITNGRPVVKYYLDSEWESHPRLRLIPWSTNQTGKMRGGDVTLTVTVAEVGAPPKLLEYAAKLFTKNKGDLAEMMKESATKLLP